MSIKFFLTNNPLTPDPKDCRAMVVSNGTKTLNDAIEEALQRGTLVTRTDLKAVTEIMFDVLTRFVSEGYTVITPLCRIRPSIKGAFVDDQAIFDPQSHVLKATLRAGDLLRDKLVKAKIEKVKASKNNPEFTRLTDQKSDTIDSEITPGGMARVTGDNLQFDFGDPDQGFFFIAADNTETKVTDFMEYSARKVIFSIPATLTQGHYSLAVRTRFYSQEMRKGSLENLVVR